MSGTVEKAEQHVLALRTAPRKAWSTRDRILLEASQLFATHGFRGASTRQIAERVGVKQPSLFKHFASKRAMLAELTIYDMKVPSHHAQAAAAATGSAVDRFAGYLAWDFEWYRTMPFDLRGVTEQAVRSERLDGARKAVNAWNEAIGHILDQGVASGEFLVSAVPFVPGVLETMSWHMVHAKDANEETVDDAVQFVLSATVRPRKAPRR
ncbi:MAG: TetR/AcrR family transcriptional regulator [Actinomycetes bacterium]